MTTIVILIIVLIFALLIVPFTRQMVKDKEELAQNPINKKFEVLVGVINEAMLNGKGELALFDDDPKAMNLMSDDMQNMLIQFYYSTGHLTIILKYKYFHNELIFKKEFYNLRNATIFAQRDVANEFIELSKKKIAEHQQKVGAVGMQNISGNSSGDLYDSDPMDMVRGMYSGLSQSQKKSAVNFLYTIGKSNGSSDSDILNNPAFSQLVLILNVLWNDCKQQLNSMGEDEIYSSLKGADDAVISMLILHSSQLVIALSAPSSEVDPILEKKFFDSFRRLGYSQENVEEELEKMMLMSQMFNQ